MRPNFDLQLEFIPQRKQGITGQSTDDFTVSVRDIFIILHYPNTLILKGCTESFVLFKNCSPRSLLLTILIITWEDLLEVVTARKINPLCQTCQAAFYSAAAFFFFFKTIIFFCSILKAKDKPLAEQLQLKQLQNKWILSSYFSSLENLSSSPCSEVT